MLKRPPKRPNHVTSIINPLTPGSCDCNLQLISFKLVFGIDFCISCEIACRWIQQDLTDETWLVNVNIGSGNGLVPTGIKPLPEPMLTKFYDKMASLSHSELRFTSSGNALLPVYDFKYFQALPFGLFEFEDL